MAICGGGGRACLWGQGGNTGIAYYEFDRLLLRKFDGKTDSPAYVKGLPVIASRRYGLVVLEEGLLLDESDDVWNWNAQVVRLEHVENTLDVAAEVVQTEN